MRHGHVGALLAVCLIVAWGCQKQSSPGPKKPEPPAKVARPGDEQTLNTITLTEKAEGRLGIRTVELKLAAVRRKQTFGGEVIIPPGQTIIVSAPVAGTLSAPEGSAVPSPGSTLGRGQPVFGFTPLLSPERDVLTPAERIRVAQTKADLATAQIEAERQIESAKVGVEAAQIAFDRAVRLLENKAGSQRSVDEAGAALKLAGEALATARARHRLLSSIRLEEEAGELSSRVIRAPVAGVLRSIDVAPGETVTAGAPLFHVVRLDRLWIRVPVYVGQWRQIDTSGEAAIAEYGRPPEGPTRPAQYVSAPPSADPVASTVDLFYEVANQEGGLVPGQKLAVTLPMHGEAKSLVAPRGAILYDIYGGAWVYEQAAPQTYVRRRVQVQYVDGPDAILARGPEPGARLVTDGAAELFGTEFGVGK